VIDLSHHLYVNVAPGVVSDKKERGAMFAMQPNVGAIFGAHLLLECGALYRNVPVNALTLDLPGLCEPSVPHLPSDAQVWDCYSTEYRVIEYTYLRGLATRLKGNGGLVCGRYLFTLIPHGDGFSRHLDQSKEFVVSHCVATGRLFIRPTDKVMFVDHSLPTDAPSRWPTHLTRQWGLMPSSEK
jgi:hypothetical protein